MGRPLLLDLFCGGGGAAMGYHRAGFDVIGVDIEPQPHYPFEFVQMNAIDFLVSHIDRFAAIHASPPCQAWSKMSKCRPGLAERYAKLIKDTRAELQRTGLPYVIENVPGAPLENPIELCGFMFGRALYRHRWFESNLPLMAPVHPEHSVIGSAAGHWRPGTIISVAGHFSPVGMAREVMAIDWMNREEMAEAIPPYFTEFLGAQVMDAVKEGSRP